MKQKQVSLYIASLGGRGLTFPSPVPGGCCWMGWPSCFSVLGFRPHVLTEEVLSENTTSPTGDRCASRVSHLTPIPFPSDNPFCQVSPALTTQGKGMPGPGQSHAAASPHISWGWQNRSHGSCCSQQRGLAPYSAFKLRSSGQVNPEKSRRESSWQFWTGR